MPLLERGMACCGITFGLALLSYFWSSSTLANTLISAASNQFYYVGRIDFANPAAPRLSWPGTSISANFTGSYLAITLDDQFGRNYFNVFIDNDFSKPIILECIKGEHRYAVAEKLMPGSHHFLLTKRTEGEEGESVFKGIELASNEKLLAKPERLQRRIEFFGDSITSGMGNESQDEIENRPEEKNNFFAYSAITARNLNAEAHIISQSGIGIMSSWVDVVMPEFYNQLNAVGYNHSQWDFSLWTPDVVVINLFQNDYSRIDQEHMVNPIPTDSERIKAYVAFVKLIRAKYPNTFIICSLGSMDAARSGSPWPSYIRAAVAQLIREQPQEKIDTLFFPFTGFSGHPRVKQHQANADLLTGFIRQKMQW